MSDDSKINRAIKSAQQVLKSNWKEGKFPVDPVSIAKKMGIGVATMFLPDKISSALIKEKGSPPVIVLSQNDSLNQWRFNCACELGRYIYKNINHLDCDEYLNYGANVPPNSSSEEDAFINLFAENLLMPIDEVTNVLNKEPVPVFLLPQHFGVLDDAMNSRLKKLGLESNHV